MTRPSLGDKKDKKAITIFDNYSQGVLTSRDAWCVNFSKKSLIDNISGMVSFYNQERQSYHKQLKNNAEATVEDVIDNDVKSISWSRALKNDLKRNKDYRFSKNHLTSTLYRPFISSNFYFDRHFNEMVYQMPSIFPLVDTDNKVICVVGKGEKIGFSCLISNKVPNYHFMASSQCFPLYLYEEIEEENGDTNNFQLSLTPSNESNDEENIVTDDNGKSIYRRKDAITNEGLAHFANYYDSQMNECDSITKEDLFYYIYGLFHSEDYRERYGENLSKQLPNIPRVKSYENFVAFSKSGRKLADLHVNYESVDMYQGVKFNSKRKHPTNPLLRWHPAMR